MASFSQDLPFVSDHFKVRFTPEGDYEVIYSITQLYNINLREFSVQLKKALRESSIIVSQSLHLESINHCESISAALVQIKVTT